MTTSLLLLNALKFDLTVNLGHVITFITILAALARYSYREGQSAQSRIVFEEQQLKLNKGQEEINKQQIAINTKLEEGIRESKAISHSNSLQISASRESLIEVRSDIKHTSVQMESLKSQVGAIGSGIIDVKEHIAVITERIQNSKKPTI